MQAGGADHSEVETGPGETAAMVFFAGPIDYVTAE
jgi:hypothetical protein